MPELDPELKARVKQHLGYDRPACISPALLQIFNRNCKQFQSNSDIYGRTGNTVIILVERCDFALRSTDISNTAATTQYQQILGDTNRQTRTFTARDIIAFSNEIYLMECDRLAAKMGDLPNLQRPEQFKKYRSMNESYTLVSPEIPDTCVSDRIYLSMNYI